MALPTKKVPSWLLNEPCGALTLDAIALMKIVEAVAVREAARK
jgi:hypothetical protein